MKRYLTLPTVLTALLLAVAVALVVFAAGCGPKPVNLPGSVAAVQAAAKQALDAMPPVVTATIAVDSVVDALPGLSPASKYSAHCDALKLLGTSKPVPAATQAKCGVGATLEGVYPTVARLLGKAASPTAVSDALKQLKDGAQPLLAKLKASNDASLHAIGGILDVALMVVLR